MDETSSCICRSKETSRFKVILLPFIAHGHISPFFELAKHLSTSDSFDVYICSTPINLTSLRNKLQNDSSISIKFIELHLPESSDLPPHYHTTNGLPTHLKGSLLKALEMASSTFSDILDNLKPDLLIYDFSPSWALKIGRSHNIPAVFFITVSAASTSVLLHMSKSTGESYPFPNIYIQHQPLTETDRMMVNTAVSSCKLSCELILVKSFRELEGKYLDFVSSFLPEKTLIPVGPLVQVPILGHGHGEDEKTTTIMSWLQKRENSSVVFVCFGSECFLSNEQLEELANGLEISRVDFIWAVRFQDGGDKNLGVLSEKFLENVKNQGLVVEGWVPQARILGHSSTGAFASHCGWGSVMESLKFGVPVIAMPQLFDQPSTAKLIVEAGVSVEVARDSNGVFKREEIAAAIRNVVVETSGECLRKKARELSKKMNEDKGVGEMDRAVEELEQLCIKKKALHPRET